MNTGALDRLSPSQGWVLALAVMVGVGVVGWLARPAVVWDGFLWQYFWGPVYADANDAVCAVMQPTGPELLYSQVRCATMSAEGAILARPGYTLVSEVGYIFTLLFSLIGLIYLLRRLDLGTDQALVGALVPFMFFGGVLRVIEDANDAALSAGLDTLLSYPANTLFISPIIYFTVFGLAIGSLVLATALYRRGAIERWDRGVFAAGATFLTGSVVFLGWFVMTELRGVVPGAGIYPQMAGLVLIGSLVVTVGLYGVIEGVRPSINAGTGALGGIVIFAHTLDGIANVLAADWVGQLGIPARYGAKHPVNRGIIELTQSLQPEALSVAVGTSWPFLVVKLLAATFVLAIFDGQLFEESPRYTILLLVAIIAVGLGPGTRDMVRVTLGI